MTPLVCGERRRVRMCVSSGREAMNRANASALKQGPLSVTRKIGVTSPVSGSVRSSISGPPSSSAAASSASCTEAIASRCVCVAVTGPARTILVA